MTADGKCEICGAAAVTRTHCAAHARAKCEYVKRRYRILNPEMGTHVCHCTACGEAGHYASTCAKRPPKAEISTDARGMSPEAGAALVKIVRSEYAKQRKDKP